mmetsp:Transcript_18631/g.46512  ORF Transcript_18631/g.46512 Transcript_18631/m.46512 type:complete len:248 (+) Transcript_18631:1035-1778(+)
MLVILFFPSHSSRSFGMCCTSAGIFRSRFAPSSKTSSSVKQLRPPSGTSSSLFEGRYSRFRLLANGGLWWSSRSPSTRILLNDKSKCSNFPQNSRFSIFLIAFWYSSRCTKFTHVSSPSIRSMLFAISFKTWRFSPTMSRLHIFWMRAVDKTISGWVGSSGMSFPSTVNAQSAPLPVVPSIAACPLIVIPRPLRPFIFVPLMFMLPPDVKLITGSQSGRISSQSGTISSHTSIWSSFSPPRCVRPPI